MNEKKLTIKKKNNNEKGQILEGLTTGNLIFHTIWQFSTLTIKQPL